jgi:DNA-binding IclR family transcriptional regulator
MKSLQKTLDILEYITCQNGRGITPSELSKKCGVNITSCVRMVQTLADRGYLEQLSRREGYVPGPASAAFGYRKNKYNKLIEGAIEPLKKLSQRTRGMVNISVIHRDKRYLLYFCGATPNINLQRFSMKWHYLENATERLLLAAKPQEDRKRIINQIGLPDIYGSMEEFEHELDEILNQGYVKFWSTFQNYWIVGGVVIVPEYPIAAIGFAVPTEADADLAIGYVLEAAEEIKRNLSPQVAMMH